MAQIRRCAQVLTILLLAGQVHAQTNGVEGFTEPYRDIDVAAPEPGLIAGVEVEEGQRIKQGRLLARLDERVLKASLEIAKAGQQSAGPLETALAELRLKANMFEKIQELRAQKFASQQEVDQALSQRDVASSRVKSVREELLVKSLEFQRIQAQLERRRIYSPIDGVVTRIYKDEGEYVSPGDPIVVKVVQLDPLLVVFPVPMTQASDLAVEQQVSLLVGEAKTPVQGTIEFVSPTADPQSGTTRVRVRFANPDEQHRSGATCRLLLSK